MDLPAGAREIWIHKDGTGDWSPKGKPYYARSVAVNWLESKVAQHRSAGAIEINWNNRAGIRANASRYNRAINVSKTDSAGTHVHELGHHVEYSVPGVQKAAQEFLAYRTKGQQPQQLKKVLPGRGYRPDERGCDDEWKAAFGDNAWYVGKHYDHGSTEIISMGIEKLFSDPIGFAEQDREYFAFIVGILDGSLRKP